MNILPQSDNNSATGIENEAIKQRHSKIIDMLYHWVQDKVQQKQFDIYWEPGIDNLADYFSKHHPMLHHKNVRMLYLKT